VWCEYRIDATEKDINADFNNSGAETATLPLLVLNSNSSRLNLLKLASLKLLDISPNTSKAE